MRTDNACLLRNAIDTAGHAFDCAAVKRDTRKGARHGAALIELSAQLWETVPTSPQGAAVLLSEAIEAVEESDDPLAPWFCANGRRIAARLRRGVRRLADLTALRTLEDIARRRFDEKSVAELIGNAAGGAATPIAITSCGLLIGS